MCSFYIVLYILYIFQSKACDVIFSVTFKIILYYLLIYIYKIIIIIINFSTVFRIYLGLSEIDHLCILTGEKR